MSVIELPKPPIEAPPPASPGSRADARMSVGVILAWSAVALGLAVLAMAMPINHDEGQYVAAEALAASLRPYADFVYLQTPLQLYLAAPLTQLMAGYAFVGLRVLSALMGAGTLGAVYAAQRLMGVERGRAALGAALMGACYIFQFSVALARNDALPALLESLAMLAGLAALRDRRRAIALWSAAGLCLGLAASVKISYAVLLAGGGLYVLWSAWRRQLSLGALLGVSAGAALGLSPCLFAAIPAPANFLFGVYTFAATAPMRWYRDIGLGRRLSLPMKLWESLFHLAIGPALGVLAGVVALAVQRWRARDPQRRDRRFVEVLALAGLLAALAPTPVQRQYFMPLLPPLFVLWGRIDAWDWVSLRPRLSRAVFVLTTLGAVIGAGRLLYVLCDGLARDALRGGPPALHLTAEAHWIGARLRAVQASGDIATLSPQVALDSGYPIDPRFASGAFLYRSGDMLSADELRRLHAVSPRTLTAALDAAPPAAIVTGYERPEGLARRNLDDDLRAYARAHRYARQADPAGKAELYIRPAPAKSAP